MTTDKTLKEQLEAWQKRMDGKKQLEEEEAEKGKRKQQRRSSLSAMARPSKGFR